MAAFLVYVLVLVPLAVVPFVYFNRAARRRAGDVRLPPSPWGLPVIGHLHHLVGALPHVAMRDLARRHGPLMMLRLGELPVVVASSAEAAREVMRTRDLDFATRPMSRMTRLVFPEGGEGIIFAPYGDRWRELRKICTVELLSARRVQSFRPVREEEVGRLLRAVAASSGQAVNLSELLSAHAADSSVRAIMGDRFKDRDAFLAMLERGLKLFAKPALPDLYPSSRLAMFLSRMPRRMKQHHRDMVAFLDAIIQEHQENRSAAGDDDDNDLLDVLLRIQREGDLQFPLSSESIKATIGDMLVGGSETAATTLHWIMAELVRNPKMMQKAQDEIRRELIGHRKVTEDALCRLNYMHMVIKEALRLHPPGSLLLPRECRRTCQVLGYDIPKGATVFVNVSAIGRDPKYWDEAEEFIPKRFEHSDVDFKGTHFEYTPFGAGRRMCPGMAFGLANVELTLASLLYHFNWELPSGMHAESLDMTEEMRFTTRRLHDLFLIPVVHVPLPTISSS
uniref:Cytochrome P450 n=1 Tax=Oryza meridionalis TaxID=40149 RepID=A0A0E0E480_9ORYZ